MKKIQEKVETVVYKDVFVSVDGLKFDTEADCKAWETSYKGTMAANWKLINKAEANGCNLGLPYSNEDDECYIIEPKTLDEITVINAYIASSTGSAGDLTMEHIGKLLVLNFGYDHDYCDVYVLSKHIENITNYIAKLEKELHGEHNEEEK